MFNSSIWNKQAEIINEMLDKATYFDKKYRLPPDEFFERQKKVWEVLKNAGFDCGIFYSDEHYCGDVPYLAGNNNIIVEPIAAVLGEKGLFFIAGIESAIVAQQFCTRSGVKVRSCDFFKIDETDYPQDILHPTQIIEEACGKKPTKIALMTTKYIFPLGLYNVLRNYVGEENITDLSEKYYEIKYEKSDLEMKLIEQSCKLSDTILEGMVRIIRPGIYETQVAEWGYLMANELGAEELGFKIMITAGNNNKNYVGRASNNIIEEGDVVSLGISPKRDGLCGAQRASVMCVDNPSKTTREYKLWMGFLEGAFEHAVQEFKRISEQDLPGYLHEESMISYYDQQAENLREKTGLELKNFSELKGYVTTHNSGYTECQEFYGALSCDFSGTLANQMVMMVDTGLKGYRNNWDDIVIPNLEYIVIEKTLGKFGKEARILNDLPTNLQYLVGKAF